VPRREARIDPPDQLSDDHHGAHRANAPRPHHEARADDRVIHEILKIGGLQRQRGVIGEADDRDEENAGREVAIAEQRRPHEGLVRGEGMDEEQVECRGGDDGLDDDLAGAEPVELFAAVQQDLQGADRQAQGAETEPIQLRRGVPCRLGQKSRHAEEGKDTDRQIDVEDIAPTIGLGQPAAEHRPKNGTGHHRDAP
jgi:hypothetical protein